MAPNMPPDELIDDSNNDNPVAGLNGTIRLRDRFRYRLSHLLGRDVSVSEANESQPLHIYVGSKACSTSATRMGDDHTHELTRSLQITMRNIARCADKSPQREDALRDQWDLILLYVSAKVHNTIMSLRQVFSDYRRKFDAVITQILGLDDVDDFGSTLDTELGDAIITLQQLTSSYDSTVKKQNELVEFAWNLVHRYPAAEVRLRSLLGSVFSDKLFDLVCRLSYPLSTHHTFVRTASTYPVFKMVTIHLNIPPLSTAISSPPRTSIHPQQSQALQTRKSASPSRNTTPPQRRLTSPKGTMMETIRRYLSNEDHELGLLRLQPASKQEVAVLVGCLLHDLPVPPGSDTYYKFGFSTCLQEKHVRDLAHYYRQLLDTTLDPTIVFQGIKKALEHGTLPGLLRNKGRHDLDKSFPMLTQFLAAKPEKRCSVYRLIQFVRDDDNDEPLPCLKRDYGFSFCTQREHVTNLKALYARIIDKAGPQQLHYACTFGRLREHAVGALGFVDPSMRRLLQNDYPNPTVGYDNTRGLEKFLTPLFKRSLKG